MIMIIKIQQSSDRRGVAKKVKEDDGDKIKIKVCKAGCIHLYFGPVTINFSIDEFDGFVKKLTDINRFNQNSLNQNRNGLWKKPKLSLVKD